jgi:hypothetical protein
MTGHLEIGRLLPQLAVVNLLASDVWLPHLAVKAARFTQQQSAAHMHCSTW